MASVALNLITAPATEPLTASEVKTWLKQDGSGDDTLITSMIVGARQWVEEYTHRALITQTWELVLDEFPRRADCPIWLPKPPAIAITSIKYDDEDGNEQTWTSTLYRLTASDAHARVTPAFGESWPSTRVQTGAVRVRYTAGYGAAAAVPDAIKQAMYHLLAHWYENRNPTAEMDEKAERQVKRVLDAGFALPQVA